MYYDCLAIQRAAFLTPGPKGGQGLTMNWHGDTGAGKSAMLEALTRELGLACEVVLGGLREPADFLGYPVPQEDGTMTYYPADFVKRANMGPSVIYLDEINYMVPAVQGASQRMVLERIVGDAPLNEDVRFMMSMNPIDVAISAGGSDLSMALVNRIGQLAWIDPDVSQWGEWLLRDHDETPPAGDYDVIWTDTLKRWTPVWAKARALVFSFLTKHPSLFKAVPSPNSPAASKPFPTQRSWENATRAYASGLVHGLDEESRWAFMGAFIGREPVDEFATWVEQADLPDPEEVLDGKVKFKHDPRRLDVTMAVLAACAALVTPEHAPKRQDRAIRFWEVIETTANDAPDIAVAPVRAMVQAKGRLGNVSQTARKVMAAMHPVLQVARVHANRG